MNTTDTPRPERVTLSDEEREALRETWDFGPFGTEAHQFAAVERILAAREQALREEIEAIAADALTIAAALVRSQGEDRTHVVDGQKRHLSAIAKGIHHRLATIARHATDQPELVRCVCPPLGPVREHCPACGSTDREGVGTGAGEGAPRQDTGSAWVTRSADCPEAPAQAHPLARHERPEGETR